MSDRKKLLKDLSREELEFYTRSLEERINIVDWALHQDIDELEITPEEDEVPEYMNPSVDVIADMKGNVREYHSHFHAFDPWESPFSLSPIDVEDIECDDMECFGEDKDGRRDIRKINLKD